MDTRKKVEKIVENLVGLMFVLVFLILFNVYYNKISFITDSFDKIRIYYNLMLIIEILIYISKIFITNKVYDFITETISTVLYVIMSIVMWKLFPFDMNVFNNPALWTKIFKTIIIITPILTIIGLIGKFSNLIKKKEE